MHYRIMYRDRKWRRADNHMDARHCPECGATVHGTHGQSEHQRWHEQLAGLLSDLSGRAGLEEADGPRIPWTAAVGEEEAEAISG